MSDHYRVLNLQPTASASEIRAAYEREREATMIRMKEDPDWTNDRLTELDAALTVLSDPGKRAEYNRSLGQSSGSKEMVLADKPPPIILPSSPPLPNVQRPCPHCNELNPVQAKICLACGGQITRQCPSCGNVVGLDETVCPRCEAVITEYAQARFSEAVSVDHSVQDDRRTSQARVSALEALHARGRQATIVFWIVVVGACISICLFALIAQGVFGQIFR